MTKWVALLCLVPGFAAANNLHLIEANRETGYAIFRTGAPGKADMVQLCKLGVTEMMVLSGDAQKYEFKHASACPTLKVIYNEEQDSEIPLSDTFLQNFDAWVASAKAQGKRIAIRCYCGCHRTGRLAAYYQMKYQNLTVKDALDLMHQRGKLMLFYQHLKPQVKAMANYINGEPCSVDFEYCVTSNTQMVARSNKNDLLERERFPAPN